MPEAIAAPPAAPAPAAAAAAPAPAAAAAPAPAAAPAAAPATPAAAGAPKTGEPAAGEAGSLLENAGKSGEAPKPGEAKPGEQAAKKGAPEAYADPKLPEGMSLDKGLWDKATALFKKHDLSQETVQEFATLQAEHAKLTAESIISQAEKQRTEQVTAWKAETKKALGAGWEKELGFAGKALDAFWPPEFRKMLTQSGLGDHPMMTAGLVALGKSMSETAPGAGGRVEVTDPKETTNRNMFPKMYDAQGKYIGGSPA